MTDSSRVAQNEDGAALAAIAAGGALAGGPCGLRTMMPLFFISRALARPNGSGAPDLGVLSPLLSPVVERALGAAAIGEVLADKAPFIPARTEALPLLGRVLFGAVAGAAGTRAARAIAEPGVSPGAITPALLVATLAGAAGALATSFAGHRLRRAATTRAGLPDLAVAVLEDLICLAWSSAIARRAAG